jgi:SAM-dependent methyltransferase
VGRRAVAISDERRWVFNRLADAYRARPPYPPALVDRLAALAGGAGARVADLGAGVGHLALPLAARGLSVAAVEPARAMLDALAAAAPPGAAVTLVHAAAEATGLPAASFDLALLADAAQWVDPGRAGREAARLLAPGGAIVVVEASFAPTPFMRGLAALLARANPRARPPPPGAVREILALAAAGAPVEEEAFEDDVALDAAALSALLRSLSYVGPALGPTALAALEADAAALARDTGGARFARRITLRCARRRLQPPRGPRRA